MPIYYGDVSELIFYYMEHSKEYYQGFIRVIDYLTPKDVWNITPEKGKELTGNYWSEIGRVLKEDYKAGYFEYGGFHVSKRDCLAPIKEDCIHIIKKIDKEDHDRWLNNTGKWIAIICGVGGFLISLLSIYLSFMAYTRP